MSSKGLHAGSATPPSSTAPVDGGQSNSSHAVVIDKLTSPASLLIFAFIITTLAYLPSLQYEFVYDDDGQFIQNVFINSPGHVIEYFTHHVWAGTYPGITGIYYRPLFLLWARLMYVLFGFDLPPIGWHLGSLFLHLAAVALLFVLARQLTGNGCVAAWAAVLFGIHPVHVEPVVWLSSVPELIFGVFSLLVFVCYLKFLQQSHRLWLWFSMTSFFAALLSKETAIVLPPLVLALHVLYAENSPNDSDSGNFWKRLRGALEPMVIMVSMLVVFIFMREQAISRLGYGDYTKSSADILRTLPTIVWFYIRHLIVGARLSAVYDPPWIHSNDWWSILWPLVPIAGFVYLLMLAWRFGRSAIFCILLMAATIAPALAGIIVFNREDVVHDRYLYLACAAWCILCAIAANKLVEAYGNALRMHVAVVAVALLFAIMTVVQAAPYRNNVVLFEYVEKAAPHNVLVKQTLGMVYMKAHRYAEGITTLQSVYNPDDFKSVHMLGLAYFTAEDYVHAEPYLKRASTLPGVDPNINALDFNLATLGLAQFHLNEVADAEKSLRSAIALAPAQNGYHYALGRILEAGKNYAAARTEFELELTIDEDPLSHDGIARMDVALHTPKGKEK